MVTPPMMCLSYLIVLTCAGLWEDWAAPWHQAPGTKLRRRGMAPDGCLATWRAVSTACRKAGQGARPRPLPPLLLVRAAAQCQRVKMMRAGCLPHLSGPMAIWGGGGQLLRPLPHLFGAEMHQGCLMPTWPGGHSLAKTTGG